MRPNTDQRADQLSLPRVTNNKDQKEMKPKHKNNEQRNPVKNLEPRDQSDRQKQTTAEQAEEKLSEKVGFELRAKQCKSDGR